MAGIILGTVCPMHLFKQFVFLAEGSLGCRNGETIESAYQGADGGAEA
jgi:hypothetical protein